MKKLENSALLSDFGEWIRKERERKELSQTEVAEELHLHQTYYSKIELAQRDVDLSTAVNICKVLGLDLSDFIKAHM
jgi:transcriptional regulator with XRE-family HTH domain